MDSPVPGSGQTRGSVPLVCNICPKNPRFSDLSHLLTHISSKAHLSTYYKIKVRAGTDEASRQSIEGYDMWYADNNIEALMSERMSQKEERKRPKIKTEARSTQKTIKKEPESPTLTSVPAPFIDSASLYPHPYAAFAPMYSWTSRPYAFTPDQGRTALDDEEERDLSGDNPLLPSKGRTGSVTPQNEEGDADETNKLKGVFWPGMGLFDAATPELKKKRNQKKDVSVSERLAAMSEEIEKKEQIFSPSGSLRKVRIISGQPESDDDLLPGEEMPPRPKKTKRVTRRKPLENKDANARKKPAVASRAKKRGRKQQAVEANADAATGDEVDDELTYKTGRNKRKKSKVPRDQDDDYKIDVQGATLQQPVAMTHLTSGYQQAPMYVPAAAMGFRPAEATYLPAQSYYQFPVDQGNPFSYDAPPLATWEWFGFGMGPSIANPLFSGMADGSFGDEDDEDNEGTISAPMSESGK